MKSTIVSILRISAIILAVTVPGMIYAFVTGRYITGGITTVVVSTILFAANLYVLYRTADDVRQEHQ